MKQTIIFIALFIICLPVIAQKQENNYVKDFTLFYNKYPKFRNEGKTDSVFFISKQCLQLAQHEQNDSLLHLSYNLLGNAFELSSDFASALDYYFKSLALAEKMNDSDRISIEAANISFAYYEVGNYRNGIDYGKQAVNSLLSSLHSSNQGSSLSNKYYSHLSTAYDVTGVSYLELSQPDSALQYLQLAYRAVLKSKDNEDLYYKAIIITDLARTYELIKEDRMAEDYFREAVYLNDSLHMQQSLGYCVKYYGNYLLRHGRLNDVKLFGRMGLAAAILSWDRISVIDIAALLQNVYDATNNKDSAYFFSKMVNNYRDTVFNTQKMVALQNTVLKREIDEREALLQQKKQAEERKANLQYAAIALAIITFVIFFFLFSHSVFANQKLIKFLGVLSLLIVFEFLNLMLHPYLGTFTHHQPIFMLAAMVCLAALLIPLHHKLEHWITHKLIEKNNKIRLVAAKKTIEQLEGKSTNAQQ